MNKRKLVIVMAAVTLATASITACGSTVPDTKTTIESSDKQESEVQENTSDEMASTVEISNSYDNTAELLKKFPVINETAVNSDIEKGIQNRLLNGFENWNRGYDAWKAWGDILYTDDSIYNVHGAKLTLAEYQKSMDVTLSQMNIQMGNFNNMVICDDWAAIRYDIVTTVQGKSNPGSTMEFINFKDYGDDLGVRVVEGWGGAKDDSFNSMSMFQTDEEKRDQKKASDLMLNYEIPNTEDLNEKYPIKNPTKNYSDNADAMKKIILEDFDAWNQGTDKWSENADSIYTTDAKIISGSDEMTLDQYKNSVSESNKTTKKQKIYFDSMLIRDDWVAIHYRYLKENLGTNEKTDGDSMEFIHFVKDGDNLKIDSSWLK